MILTNPSTPFYSIAKQTGTPYENVLAVADMYRYIEFGDTHLVSNDYAMDAAAKLADNLPWLTVNAIYEAVCAHKRAQGKFANHD